MEAAMYYMRNHINEASSSLKTKPRDFEFDFDWECKNFAAFGRTTAAKKNDLKDIQWNFSNLDRSDVSFVYNFTVYLIFFSYFSGSIWYSQRCKTTSALTHKLNK